MARIYIIRHGQTDANKRLACIGRVDTPLNDTGHEQSRALAKRLGDVTADKIYISPLTRARQTIQYYLDEHPDIPVKEEPLIIERNFGDWEGLTFDEIEKLVPAEYAKWRTEFVDYQIPGGESSRQVQSRADEFIDLLTAQHTDGTIFLVTHLALSRHLISRLLGLKIEESWRFTMYNASCAVIDYDNTTHCGVLKYLNI